MNNLNETLFEQGGGIMGYVDQILPYSYILAGILMILMVGTKIMTYFANPTKEIDPNVLSQPLLVIMALALYKPLVELLLFVPTQLIQDITEEAARAVTNAGQNDDFSKLFRQSIFAYDDVFGNGEESAGSKIQDFLQINPFLELIHLLIYIGLGTVALYIMIRQLVVKAIYLVLGVLVLPLCLVPGNQEILKKWFFGFLAVLLWIPMLRILQTIFIILFAEASKGGMFEAEVFLLTSLQLVVILCIIQVPKYANFLVGGSGDNDSNGWLFFVGREFYYQTIVRGGNSRHRRNV